MLTRALGRGGETAEAGETALVVGLVVALVSAATAMGQIERGANRIYGIERDRPSVRKYTVATALALSAGLASILAFVVLVPGAALGRALEDVTGWTDGFDTAWAIGRWPLAAVLVAGAVALIFWIAPNRSQPSPSWLIFGSTVTVVLWFAFTGLYAAWISLGGDFGDTYGPLAGLIGLLIWALLTAMALFGGIAVSAQLEAIRAGVPEPTEEPR